MVFCFVLLGLRATRFPKLSFSPFGRLFVGANMAVSFNYKCTPKWLAGTDAHLNTISGQLKMAVGQNQWYHFGVGEFTTHLRTYFSSWIGMFTACTIWILCMAKLSPERKSREEFFEDPKKAEWAKQQLALIMR